MKNRLAAIALLAFAAAPLQAQVITPAGSSFGTLAAATWGGSGIPNDAVMITTFDNVTLGMSASGRFSNPSPTNNGWGTFYAAPGVDVNAPSPANPYATWNFNWYIGGANKDRYSYVLFYDFNPAAANADHLPGPLGSFGVYPAGTQNSWNLGMDFLDPTPVGAPTFDPNAQGEYSFALVAYNGQGVEAGRSAIVVSTTTVPEPSTYALVAAGLAGLFAAHRRRRHA